MYYFYCINVKEKAQGTFLWNNMILSATRSTNAQVCKRYLRAVKCEHGAF